MSDILKTIGDRFAVYRKGPVPDAVKEAYDRAVDYYGKENTELQPCTFQDLMKDWLCHRRTDSLLTDWNIDSSAFTELWEGMNISVLTDLDTNLVTLIKRAAMDRGMPEREMTEILLDRLFTEERYRNAWFPAWCIIIHWPRFTITNEKGMSTEILDFYGRVTMSCRGLFCNLEFLRSTYQYEHYISGYIHSHISASSYDGMCKWNHMCLGQGPVNMTIHSLQDNMDGDLWFLFFHELDRLVRTESLEGGTYVRIEYIRPARQSQKVIRTIPDTFDRISVMQPFLEYVASSGWLRWAFVGDHYVIANTLVEFAIKISNDLMRFLNSCNPGITPGELERHPNSMMKASVTDFGTITYYTDNCPVPPENLLTTDLTFKGQNVIARVLENTEDSSTVLMLLKPDILIAYYHHLTLLANLNYGAKSRKESPVL